MDARSIATLFLLVAAALLIGCSGSDSNTDADTGADATPADEGAASGQQPQPTDECEALGQALGDALGMEASVSGGDDGSDCEVRITGTGADFGSLPEVSQALQSTLEAEGWTEDPSGAADGPTGTSFRVTKGTELGVISAGWEPSPDADCPDDQPIAACELAPEQQLYTITADFAPTG